MPHPDKAFAFNEHSASCCAVKADLTEVLALIDRARAWHMDNARPLVKSLTADAAYRAHLKGRLRTKLETLALVADRGPRRPSEVLMWQEQAAVGLSFAFESGGFAFSWPCRCATWATLEIKLTRADGLAVLPPCRHFASIDHLLKHWQSASRAAKKAAGRPRSVQRVDSAMNAAAGEVPQVHFADGTALNIDGSWKHHEHTLSVKEREWLTSVGWLLPPAAR